MRKKFLTIASLLCFSIGMHAQSKFVRLETKSVGDVTYTLEESPRFTFDDNTLTMVSSKGTTQYKFSDITKLLFGEESKGLKGDVNADGIVNIDDVSTIIGIICGAEKISAADVNGDGNINIDDVSSVISIICGQ